jgi:DNA polymerase III subunit alpha
MALDGTSTYLDKAIRYGQQVQAERSKATISLFDTEEGADLPKPRPPRAEPWSLLEKLRNEKSVVGFYISGHPLEPFRMEIQAICTANSSNWAQPQFKDKEVWMAAIVSAVQHKRTKQEKPFMVIQLEDLEGNFELALYGNDTITYGSYFIEGHALLLKMQVRPRFGQDNTNLELKPRMIELLAEAKDKVFSGVTLRLAVEQLNSANLQRILTLASLHPGSKSMYLEIMDATKQIQIETKARRIPIDTSPAFLQELEALDIGKFRLNRGSGI